MTHFWLPAIASTVVNTGDMMRMTHDNERKKTVSHYFKTWIESFLIRLSFSPFRIPGFLDFGYQIIKSIFMISWSSLLLSLLLLPSLLLLSLLLPSLLLPLLSLPSLIVTVTVIFFLSVAEVVVSVIIVAIAAVGKVSHEI